MGTRYRAEERELRHETYRLVERPTLCYAIHAKEKDQLLKAYRNGFEENHLEYTRDRQVGGNLARILDTSHHYAALEGHEIHRNTDRNGLINWTVIAWRKQTGFFCKKMKIQYGNCPHCMRALPMGWECPNQACVDKRDHDSKQLFVVEPGTEPSSKPRTKQACDPLLLGDILGHHATVSLDEKSFQKCPENVPYHDQEVGMEYYGYRHDDPDLWGHVDLKVLLERIDMGSRPKIEQDLAKMSKLPIYIVEQAMDDYNENCPGKIPNEVWTNIVRERSPPE